MKPGDKDAPGETFTCSVRPGEKNGPWETVSCSDKIQLDHLKKPNGVFACSAEIHKGPVEINACSSEIPQGPVETFACSAEIKMPKAENPAQGKSPEHKEKNFADKDGCKPHSADDYACVARFPGETEKQIPGDYACVARIPAHPDSQRHPDDYACVAQIPDCTIEDLTKKK